jgi:hypothetical protein
MAGSAPGRPTGITIIAVVALIAGILQIFGGLGLITVGGLIASVGLLGGGFVFIGGLALLAFGVADLALAYGFWTVKTWAWRLGVVLALANVAWAVVSLVLVSFDLTNVLVTIVVAAIWIYYLNLPSIRAAFGAPASGLPIVGKALDPYLSRIKI